MTLWPTVIVGAIAAPARNALVGGPFGSNLTSRDYVDKGVPVIRGANMGDRWVGGAFVYVTKTKADSLAANCSGPGDLIFTQRGTLGQVALVPKAGPSRYLVSQSQMKLTVDEDKADPLFIYYVFASQAMREHVRLHAIQTGVPHTNLGILRETPLLLPPVAEQHAIATVLGALDDKIECNRCAVSLMEELVRAEFDRLFDLHLVADGVPLSALLDVNPRRSLTGGTSATYVGMAALPEFSAEVYTWETRVAGSGQRFSNGDVLMARITPCLENGKTAVVDMLAPGEVGWGSTEYVVLAPRGEISTEWIYCVVRNEAIRDFAIRSMTGTSGRQRFQADRFDQYRVVEPPHEALAEFNGLSRPLFARMTQLRDENLKLAALRDTLLPELLSGRIRVPEAEQTAVEATA